MKTGYGAYVLYLFTKTQLQYSTYDHVIRSIENKSHWYEKYLKGWNNKRADRDGIFFQKIEELHSLDEIARIFFVYYMKNNDFYVTDYFDDDGKTFSDFNECLHQLETILKKDWQKFKAKGDYKYKLFNTTYLINTNITIFSKAILLQILDIDYTNIEMLELETKLFKKNMLEINKLLELYPARFNKKYWINYFKNVLINI